MKLDSFFWCYEWERCGFLDSNDKRVCVIWRIMKALKLFKLILNSSSHLNHFTFSTVLDACAGYSDVLVGNQFHACILMSSCWPPLLTCMLNVETLKLLSAFLSQSLQEIRSLEVMQTWACRCLRGCWRVVSGLGILLGSYGLHSCLELGEIAANGIYTLEHNHPAVYLGAFQNPRRQRSVQWHN